MSLISDQGYRKIYMSAHPRADSNGYIKEHIVIAEHALGHALPARAVIHHVNEQRAMNTNNNLVICQDETYHKLLHKRLRAYRATGSALARKCIYCKQWEQPTCPDMYLYKKMSFHRSCHSTYECQRKRKKNAE